jgi:recombination protein RecT
MSEVQKEFQNAVAIMVKLEDKFIELVKTSNTDVAFKNELLYASQAMLNNDYLCRTALSNSLSLRNAFSQVAACGLTLNPARGFAYLVPRDGQVILDVSYRGMIKAAVNDAAIKDCIVELVYANDEFVYRGKRQSPTHTFNPFDKKADRGEFVGAFVEALLPDGRVHVEAVTAEEIYAAREASELWRKKKKGPWVDFFAAMAKKSAIKIARKYWPQSGPKLDELIQYLNTNSGEGFASHDVPLAVVERVIGAGDAVEPTEPLPTSNQVDEVEVSSEPSPAAQPAEVDPEPERADPPAAEPAADPEPQAVEGEVMPAKEPEPKPAELPEKVVKKVAELVRRARDQGCWAAAKEYVSTWPEEARQYALQQLKAGEYLAASEGE